MSTVSRDELMLYCRVDGNEIGDLVVELAESAEAYLQDAGCTYTTATLPVYRQTVKELTLHYLDHPGEPVPSGTQSKINHLKFTPAAEAAGTE